MVARTPVKQQRKIAAAPPPISPTLLRDTVKKVDKCMARLQELQYTVTGGKKVVSGVSLSPRSGRNYLRTSLRCKQESLRLNNDNFRRSPPGKLPVNSEEWRKMSLPAMLLGETMGEILQATQFAKNIVEAVSSKTQKPAIDDPKTPLTERRERKPILENLPARRRREKQVVLQNMRSDSNPPSLQRAKSKINFKTNEECDKENCKYITNRVSPRNRPWVKKTVLFPNPLFHSSSPTSHHHKFAKTKSPMISRTRASSQHKSPVVSISPTRAASLKKKSPKGAASGLSKLRRSFSPSRLANRLASPLKSRKKNEVMMMKMGSGVKQRSSTPFSIRRLI